MSSNQAFLKKIGLIGIFFFVSSFPIAHAHVLNYGAIRTELEAKENEINLYTEVSQQISYGTYYGQDQSEFLDSLFQNRFAISHDGKPCDFKLISLDNIREEKTTYRGSYVCPSPINDLDGIAMSVSIFDESFTTFDHFVNFKTPNGQWTLIFTNEKQDYPTQVAAVNETGSAGNFFAVLGQFTWLGVKHIFTGYDHILFLIMVVLLVRSLKKILILVTSFTLAHSITLILAGLKIVTLPSTIVEPAIALSIMYVAFQNFRSLRDENQNPKLTHLWFTTFGFGLVHGLGFAGALAETKIPNSFFVPALIIFNLGIEIGQLGILTLAIPLIRQADKLPRRNQIFKAVSIIAGLVALVWFILRTI